MNTLLLSLLLACGSAEAPTPEPTPEPVAAPEPAKDPKARPKLAAPKLDINTATEEALKAKMPEVGAKMLHEFEEYRPYKSIVQFRKEMGKYVDEATVASYEQHIYVPIAFDSCDGPTLMQIPDLDKAKAKTLMDGRPYKTPEAFIKAVGTVAGPEQAGAAKSLLGG